MFGLSKLWVYGIAAVLLSGGLFGGIWYTRHQAYDAGYDARVQEEKEDYTIALNAAIEDARGKWILAAAAAIASSKGEETIVEKIRVIEKKVPQIVERVVPSECRDLGLDIHQLLVEATRAANGSAASGATDPAEPVDTLPGVPRAGERPGG